MVGHQEHSTIPPLPRPNQTLRDVYTQMMTYKTNLSDESRTKILDLIDHLRWPSHVFEEYEIGNGSQIGFHPGWSKADNQVLVALRNEFGLRWEEIAGIFYR
jgi:hypothetical protein